MSSAYEKLKAKWDRKLLDSGFHDIENKDGSLKGEVDPRTISNALKDKDAREIYYRMATAFLEKHKFASNLERAVWVGHIEGISFRDIAEATNTTFYKVRNIVIKFQRMSGVKI